MASKQKGNDKPSFYLLRELASGGITNSIASFILNPMDVTKIRMQTEGALQKSSQGDNRIYKTFKGTAFRILKDEGILGLWLPGLLPSMLRELTYSSMRMVIISHSLIKHLPFILIFVFTFLSKFFFFLVFFVSLFVFVVLFFVFFY